MSGRGNVHIYKTAIPVVIKAKTLELKFTRITGCTGTADGLEISHDYGKLFVPWNDIICAFAAKIRSLEGQEIPILLFGIKEQAGFFYIDGVKVSTLLFKFMEPKTEGLDRNIIMSRSSDAIEKKFKWVAQEICSHLQVTYIDKSVAESIKGSTFFLPIFNSLIDVGAHCNDIIASVDFEETKGFMVLEEDDGELKKITAPTERKEWKEGMVIEEKYTIQEIKKGGMGIIFIVFDTENAKFYAVKTFQERFIWNDRIIKQFVKEAEIWINLDKHPHIVKAELVKIIEGKPYIFLEYITGIDLETIIENERLHLGTSLALGIQFCEGMSYAYRKLGLIHRDIKPSNCFISKDGLLKITDFGLGKIFDESPIGGEPLSIQNRRHFKDIKSSSSSALIGTLPFMAPELFYDLNASSIRSDIYSTGVMFYMMLTGKNPFYHEDPTELIIRHLEMVPIPPYELNSEVPVALSELVLKCLNKNPENRYSSFEEIKSELEKLFIETHGRPYVLPEKEETLSEDDWINKGISLASLDHHRAAVITFEQALRINPDSIAAKVQKGKSLLILGQINDALTCFDEVMIDNPKNWEAWFYRGETLWKKGKKQQALIAYDKAIELEPTRPDVLGRRGNLLAEMGRVEEALSCLDQAMKKNPAMEDLWDKKGEMLLNLLRLEEATKCFDKAIEINPRLASAWAHRGDALYWLGFFQEAIDAYNNALTITPDSLKERLGIGRCYQELGDTRKALIIFDQTLKVKKNYVDTYLAKARLLKEMYLPVKAISCLRNALQYEPHNKKVSTELARLYIRMGFFDKALSLCNYFIKKDEKDWEIELLKESASLWIAKKEEITSKISQLPTLKEEDIYRDISSLLGVFYRLEDARNHLQNILEIKEDPHKFFLLAKLQKLTGDLDGALMSAEKAIRLKIEYEEARLLLQEIKKESEREKEKKVGIRILSRMFRKETKTKENAEELLVMGIEKLFTSDYLKAYNFFKDSLKKNPEFYICWFLAGIAQKYLGNLEKSEKYFQTFLEKFPRSPGYYKFRILTAPSTTDRKVMHELFQQWIGPNPREPGAWLSYLKFFIEGDDKIGVHIITSEIVRNYVNTWYLSKRSSVYWNLRGILELLQGNVCRAMNYFTRSLKYNDNDPVALLGCGKCYELNGNVVEAMKKYEKLFHCKNASIMALYQTAHLYMKNKKEQEALHVIEKAIGRMPNSLILGYKKGQILVESANYNDFLRYYNSAFHIEGKFPPFYRLRAFSLANTGKLNDAIMYMKNALSLNPGNRRLIYTLAILYLKARDHDAAIEHFDQLLSEEYPMIECYTGKGMALYQKGHYQEAIKFFGKFLNFWPDDPNIYLLIGASYFHLDNYEQAENHFKKTLDLKSRFIKGWSNLSIFYCRLNQYNQSLQFSERALRIDKESFAAWLCRGKAKEAMGNLEEAYKSVVQALFYETQDSFSWTLRGLIEYKMGKLKNSLESYSKACEIEDRNAQIWYNRGVVALALSEFGAAEKFFTRAIDLDPNIYEAWLGKAVFYKIHNKYNYYQEAMSKAESIVPDIFETWASKITSSTQPNLLLSPREVGNLDFDLPYSYDIEIVEPIHVLNYDSLDGNF